MQSMSHNNESKPLQGFFRKYRNVLYCIAGILGVALVIFLIVWLSDYLGVEIDYSTFLTPVITIIILMLITKLGNLDQYWFCRRIRMIDPSVETHVSSFRQKAKKYSYHDESTDSIFVLQRQEKQFIVMKTLWLSPTDAENEGQRRVEHLKNVLKNSGIKATCHFMKENVGIQINLVIEMNKRDADRNTIDILKKILSDEENKNYQKCYYFRNKNNDTSYLAEIYKGSPVRAIYMTPQTTEILNIIFDPDNLSKEFNKKIDEGIDVFNDKGSSMITEEEFEKVMPPLQIKDDSTAFEYLFELFENYVEYPSPGDHHALSKDIMTTINYLSDHGLIKELVSYSDEFYSPEICNWVADYLYPVNPQLTFEILKEFAQNADAVSSILASDLLNKLDYISYSKRDL